MVINKAVGLILCEVVLSNPNGDPDDRGRPRQFPDGRIWTSPMSTKRKYRDVVHEKGPFWDIVYNLLDPIEDELVRQFRILEIRGRDREEIRGYIKDGTMERRFHDLIFGWTFLEKSEEETGGKKEKTRKPKSSNSSIIRGVVQVGTGVSIRPADIAEATITNTAGVQEGEIQGMGPDGLKFVRHALVAIPFYVNGNRATLRGLPHQHLQLFKLILPNIFEFTRSTARTRLRMRHCWYAEHPTPGGACCHDDDIVDALMPRPIGDSETPSRSLADYEIPTSLPDEMTAAGIKLTDLVKEYFRAVSRRAA